MKRKAAELPEAVPDHQLPLNLRRPKQQQKLQERTFGKSVQQQQQERALERQGLGARAGVSPASDPAPAAPALAEEQQVSKQRKKKKKWSMPKLPSQKEIDQRDTKAVYPEPNNSNAADHLTAYLKQQLAKELLQTEGNVMTVTDAGRWRLLPRSKVQV
jgi:hypothetical protein